MFAEGLTAWRNGEESPEAYASVGLLCEVLLLHRNWVLAQAKPDK